MNDDEVRWFWIWRSHSKERRKTSAAIHLIKEPIFDSHSYLFNQLFSWRKSNANNERKKEIQRFFWFTKQNIWVEKKYIWSPYSLVLPFLSAPLSLWSSLGCTVHVFSSSLSLASTVWCCVFPHPLSIESTKKRREHWTKTIFFSFFLQNAHFDRFRAFFSRLSSSSSIYLLFISIDMRLVHHNLLLDLLACQATSLEMLK